MNTLVDPSVDLVEWYYGQGFSDGLHPLSNLTGAEVEARAADAAAQAINIWLGRFSRT